MTFAKTSRFAAATTLMVAMLSSATAPAHADIITEVKGTKLSITGDEGRDAIEVTCSGNKIKVNGQKPEGESASCGQLTKIVVKSGGGNDEVNLLAVDSADFPLFESSLIDTGPGNDGVTGSFFVDTILGGSGDDAFNPLPSNDAVFGGPGRDETTDQSGTSISITDSALNSNGGGNDTLDSVEVATVVVGGSSGTISGSGTTMDLKIIGSGYADVISTGSGDDHVLGGATGDAITTNDGDDRVEGEGGNDTITGGNGNDTIVGTATTSLTLAPGSLTGTNLGTDTFSEFERGELAIGDGGNATASTFLGPVIFKGSSGANTMVGGGGNDTFFAMGGADSANGNGGEDLLVLAGSDVGIFVGYASVDGDTVGMNVEKVRVDGTAGDDTLDAKTAPLPVTLIGSVGDDELTGGSEGDVLKGGKGRDLLKGGPGDDGLNGGPGKDSCKGGPGHDTLKSCP